MKPPQNTPVARSSRPSRSFVDEGVAPLKPPSRPSSKTSHATKSLGKPELVPPTLPRSQESADSKHVKSPERKRMKTKKSDVRRSQASDFQDSTFQQFSPETSQVGAIAVAGPGMMLENGSGSLSGSFRHQSSSSHHHGDEAMVGLEPPQRDVSDEILLTAQLVTEDWSAKESDEDSESVPKVLAEAKPLNQRRRQGLIALLVLVTIGAMLGLVLGLTLGSSGDDEASRVLLTVTFQLDSEPQETGWTLACADETVAEFPPGTFVIPNQEGSAVAQVVDQDVCSLTVVDTGSNGIEGGFFQVFLGNAVEDDISELELLAFLSGDFTDETSTTFVADSSLLVDEEEGQPIQAPTLSPAGEPTFVPAPSPNVSPRTVNPTADVQATPSPGSSSTPSPVLPPTLDTPSSVCESETLLLSQSSALIAARGDIPNFVDPLACDIDAIDPYGDTSFGAVCGADYGPFSGQFASTCNGEGGQFLENSAGLTCSITVEGGGEAEIRYFWRDVPECIGASCDATTSGQTAIDEFVNQLQADIEVQGWTCTRDDTDPNN